MILTYKNFYGVSALCQKIYLLIQQITLKQESQSQKMEDSMILKLKQIKKSKETLELYAPLAHQIGMHKMATDLEDISLSLIHI